MTKKASGLGRGLGDLLEDNSVSSVRKSVLRKEEAAADSEFSVPKTTALPKETLGDERPSNKSLKANFREFNR